MRLISTGFELNSTGAGVEFDAQANLVITSAIKRTGTYAHKAAPSSLVSLPRINFSASDITGVFYMRQYLYIVAYPASGFVQIFDLSGNDNITRTGIRLFSNGQLQLCDSQPGTPIGNLSNAVPLNTWTLIEMKVDNTVISNTLITARLNGVEFGTGAINLPTGLSRFRAGSSFINNTDELYLDDEGFNDSSGSFQNSWLGPGSIIHLKPLSAGDNNDFLTAVGGTAGAANNFTRVSEVTPDDATSYNASAGVATDDFRIESPSALNDTDTVNLVSVGVRFAGASATNEATFVVRIKGASGGTVEESAAITPNSTSFKTNANATPFTYPLTLYDMPGSSTVAWTKGDLATAQIGYRVTTGNTNADQISTLWLLVEFTPNLNPSSAQLLSLLGAQ